ncbi:hypothetical protein ACFR9U_20405 [Halorientalis brevis]|uniref:DUF7260 domain-containing protein n=1 Tax=Halorientalis brevis TaxID=1126241 RepID=A0ABD6CIE4_9EURY|nr:hypothetical protein [Halorientalis brevis]
MIVAEANTRQAELEVLCLVFDKEMIQLKSARSIVDDITAWLADANETPLTDLGFEALQHRHETLADHRDRCEKLACQRQVSLEETTTKKIKTKIQHWSLVLYIYQEFSSSYPLLSTVTRLDDTCKERQRVVRRHLV